MKSSRVSSLNSPLTTAVPLKNGACCVTAAASREAPAGTHNALRAAASALPPRGTARRGRPALTQREPAAGAQQRLRRQRPPGGGHLRGREGQDRGKPRARSRLPALAHRAAQQSPQRGRHLERGAAGGAGRWAWDARDRRRGEGGARLRAAPRRQESPSAGAASWGGRNGGGSCRGVTGGVRCGMHWCAPKRKKTYLALLDLGKLTDTTF